MQIRLSVPPVARNFPSLVSVIDNTSSVWPLNTFLSLIRSMCAALFGLPRSVISHFSITPFLHAV